jgi:hypothetical protein
MKLVRLIKMCLNEKCNKGCVGKYLSDNFPIQNDLKQGDALKPLLFNFALNMPLGRYRKTCRSSSKEVGLEVNTEKTKYMLLSRHQNAGQTRQKDN